MFFIILHLFLTALFSPSVAQQGSREGARQPETGGLQTEVSHLSTCPTRGHGSWFARSATAVDVTSVSLWQALSY